PSKVSLTTASGSTSSPPSHASVSCLSAPSCPRLASSDLSTAFCLFQSPPRTASASRRVSSPTHPGTMASRVLRTTSFRTCFASARSPSGTSASCALPSSSPSSCSSSSSSPSGSTGASVAGVSS
ncbi:MAG: hypothetical protein ACK55Z_15605, partial [bacterium]